jgi:hypothetical protein
VNSAAVWSNHLLSFPAPAMIAGIKILAGVGGDSVKHEEFLRTKRAAERRLD